MTEYEQNYRVAELIAGLLTGVLTESEQYELEKWREDHEVLYHRIKNQEEMRLRNQYVETLNVEEAWKRVKAGIRPLERKQIRKISWWRIAACFLILAGVGSSLIYWSKDNEKKVVDLEAGDIMTGSSKALLITARGQQIILQDSLFKEIQVDGEVVVLNDGKKVEYQPLPGLIPNQRKVEFHTVVVPRGGEYQLQLSDGTRIWLNSDSEIRFPVQFTGELRQVELKGEAYFEVAHDTLHPFLVEACDKMRVQVLGTAFNIKAYPDESMVYTTLNQGKVAIKAGHEKLILHPDQQALWRSDSQTLEVKQVKATRFSAWKDGKLIFEDERLETILNRLARWYNISVSYQNKDCKNFHFTGDLEKYEDFSMALRMIEKSTNLRFEVSGRTVMVCLRE